MSPWVAIPFLTFLCFLMLASFVQRQRPRKRVHKVFLVLIIPVTIWSLSSSLILSNILAGKTLALSLNLKINFVCILWLATAYYHFLRSFEGKPAGKRLIIGYGFIILLLPLIARDYILELGGVFQGAPYAKLTMAVYPIAALYLGLIGSAVIPLLRRYKCYPDAITRIRAAYVLIGLAFTVVFSLMELYPPLGRYPLIHLGNLANAFCITYAIARYQLLDLRVVIRRSLAYAGLGISLLGFYLGAIFVLFKLTHLQASTRSLIAGAFVALLVAVLFYLLREPIQEWVEKFFLKETYAHRCKLEKFSAEMGTVLNLEELANYFLALVTNALQLEKAELFLRDKTGDFIPVKGPSSAPRSRLRRDSPLLSWLRKNNQPLYLEQIDILPQMKALWESEREHLRELGYKVYFPLKAHERLVGLLALGRKRKGNYTAEDVQLVEKAANEASLLIENALLYEETQRRARQASLLVELGKIITSNLNIKVVYQAFANKLREGLQVDWVCVTTIEGQDKVKLLTLFSESESGWQEGEDLPIAGTATQWVAAHRKTHYEPDLAQEREFWTDEVFFKKGFRSLVRSPLFSKGRVIGSFVIASRKVHAFGPEDLDFIEQVCNQLSLALENSQLYAQTQEKVITDALTGLYNHRHFHERLEEEIARSSRHDSPFSLAILDLDFFKFYNDACGHLAGDEVLRQVAQAIKGAIRRSDIAFRYGGEEFALILPKTDIHQSYEVTERIRKVVESQMRAKGWHLTLSAGVATWPDGVTTKEDLIQAADAALYNAKRAGRNRVCLSASGAIRQGSQAGRQQRVPQRWPGMEIMYTLAAIIEARDPNTAGHSQKVAEYAVALAKELGLRKEKVENIRIAALLHDIGKLGIPDRILKKADGLDEREWEAIKDHPVIGVDILRHSQHFGPILPIILHHHERYDGGGYPSGLKGDQIPLEARILAVADAYDAMTSPRPYRKAFSRQAALRELQAQAGRQFDPALVRAFTAVVQRELVASV